MVFKEMVSIEGDTPALAVVVESDEPTAEMVAFHILVLLFIDIAATHEKGIEEGAYPHLVTEDCQLALGIIHIALASKLCTHLQSQFGRERGRFTFAYFQIACLTVIKHVVSIGMAFMRKVVLPMIIREPAESDMSFQMYPSTSKGKRPILRQMEAHLRDRSGIDAQCL